MGKSWNLSMAEAKCVPDLLPYLQKRINSMCVSTAEFRYSHSKTRLSDYKAHHTLEQAGSPDSPSGPFLGPTKQLLWLSPGFLQAFSLVYKVLHLTQAARSSSKRCPPLSFLSKNNSPKLSLRQLFQVLITQGRFRLGVQAPTRALPGCS